MSKTEKPKDTRKEKLESISRYLDTVFLGLGIIIIFFWLSFFDFTSLKSNLELVTKLFISVGFLIIIRCLPFMWLKYQIKLERLKREKEKCYEKCDEIFERYTRERYKNSPLLKEYDMTQQMHNYYGRMSWEIASILIAGSLAMVGFSLQSPLMKKELFIGISVAVTLVMVMYYSLFRRITQLVKIHIARLLQIERELHFHQHRYIDKALEDGHVVVEGKCYDLSGLRGRDSVKLLTISLILSVWLIAILLFIF